MTINLMTSEGLIILDVEFDDETLHHDGVLVRDSGWRVPVVFTTSDNPGRCCQCGETVDGIPMKLSFKTYYCPTCPTATAVLTLPHHLEWLCRDR